MKTRKIICVALIFALLNIGSVAALAIDDDDEHSELFRPIIIQDGMELSVADCVAAALKNSPKIRRQKYNLDIAKSNVGIAKSNFFPVIGAGVGYLHQNNSNGDYYYLKYRELPNVGVTVNQLVYDFGKSTANIKMEEFYKIGAEYEFMDSLCQTLFEVKYRYYEVLKQDALLKVAQDNVELNEHLLELGRAKDSEDVQTASLQLNKAKIKLVETQNAYHHAIINLNNAMYLSSQPNYKIKSTQTFSYNNEYGYDESQKNLKPFQPEIFDFPIEKAVDIAYQNSPDLQVLINTKNAMNESLKFVKRKYLPELRANAGYGFLNTNTTSSNNGLTVGVNLATDVNFMELKHSMKGANAQLALADNEIELFKKDLYFQVKHALSDIEKSKSQIPLAQMAITNSLENLKIVEKKYIADTLDYYAIQDAREEYIDALNRYINVLFQYNVSLIDAERAMHYHIVDIHHKSEHAVHYHSDELIKHLNEALGCDEKEVKKYKKKK